MSADISPKATPAQSGLGFVGGAAPIFDGGNLIPVADSYSCKESSEVTRTQDNEADVDNIGTAGHHLVASGDFKVKATGTIPNKGDVITDNTTPTARNWVVTGDVEVTGYSSGGKPVMIKLELEYHPKIDAAESA